MVKRGSITDMGAERRKLLGQVEHLIMSGEFRKVTSQTINQNLPFLSSFVLLPIILRFFFSANSRLLHYLCHDARVREYH